MATVAATVALSVGLAVARAEQLRRMADVRRARERQFGLLPGERLSDGLPRIALGQLDLAIELLAEDDAAMAPERAVHETRKSIKRLRALIGLIRDELGEQAVHERAVLRDAGLRLSRARDAEVMVATLDDIVRRNGRKLARRRGLAELRTRLQAERDAAVQSLVTDASPRSALLEDLRASRERIAAWRLPDRKHISLVEPQLERLYRDGRRRARRAEPGLGRAHAMHQWRKRVKGLRYAAEVLDRPVAGDGLQADNGRVGLGGHRGPHGRKRSRALDGDGDGAYLGRVARWADELAEVLGEEHDLVVFAARVRAQGTGDRRPGLPRGTRRALLKATARRRKRLRRRAIRAGRRLYRRKPKLFTARARRAYRRSAR